jgi:hypothetical protein
MVTRRDLRVFDKVATDLILEAQSKGARVRISHRGHAIILGPDGVTTASVPQNMKTRSRTSQNTKADIARMFRETEG